MIFPLVPQPTASVAAHYDGLDSFYRDVWGEHVHHGYWPRGDETPTRAADLLVDLVAAHLRLAAEQTVCDIGCGYGATAERLAQRFGVDVTGVTVSTAQIAVAAKRAPSRGHVAFHVRDWLDNRFASVAFDRAYAIESSEHMPDKQAFFDEAWRVLRPGGVFVVCAWLACNRPRRWEVRHLLEPICREGRLAGMGDEADYRAMATRAGFAVSRMDDISDAVRRTWHICGRRVLAKLATRPRYLRFLLDRGQPDRVFALTLFRILVAYRTRSMRYCVMVLEKPA